MPFFIAAKMKTLYLLPGLLCDASVWQHQQQALSGTHTVRIANFYGETSLTDMARKVLADAPEKFAIAGHSMGGRVALEIFRLAPERVERLALLDTGVHPVQPNEADKRMALLQIAQQHGMAALAAAWLPPMVHPNRLQDAALMQALTEMVMRTTAEIFAGQIQALLNRMDAQVLLEKINCPALILCGRQDNWSPLEQHQAMQRDLHGSNLVVVEDCGHMSTLEQAAAVTMALQAWLEK